MKLKKLDRVHEDLVDEYNKLYNVGKELYDDFFELYYQLKLHSNKS